MVSADPGGRTNRLEVGAVVATGLLHPLVSTHRVLLAPFIAAVLIGWGTYVTVRVRGDRGLWAVWGFTKANLKPAFRAASTFALAASAVMAAIGHGRGTLSLHWHVLVLFVLYPAWGLVQQFLVQALVARNLRALSGPVSSPWFVVPSCGVLFGLVHVPDLELVIATAVLGCTFTSIYLRWRNLWPLGLFHGWLGALCYFWVIGRDPWYDVFG